MHGLDYTAPTPCALRPGARIYRSSAQEILCNNDLQSPEAIYSPKGPLVPEHLVLNRLARLLRSTRTTLDAWGS